MTESRTQRIKKLRKKGLSLRAIGDKEKVSRQRIYQILDRKTRFKQKVWFIRLPDGGLMDFTTDERLAKAILVSGDIFKYAQILGAQFIEGELSYKLPIKKQQKHDR